VLGGIDIGATKTLVALGDDDGRPLAERLLETHPRDGGDQLVQRAAAALAELAGGSLEQLRGIGVGVLGPLRARDGVLLDPPNLGWGAYPLAARLQRRTGVPTAIDNDCNAGALGELVAGAGRGARALVYFGIGTGIGGGVILDGQLVRGASENAGELGHLIVDFGAALDGRPSAAGTVESIAGGQAIAERARALAAAGRAPALLLRAGGVGAISAADVMELALEGDEPASAIWEDGIAAVAAAVTSILNALSPEVVVIGGGVAAHAGERYVEAIALQARARAFGPNANATLIVPAELGERSVLLGALAVAAGHAA
jgi:glucokinase